VVWRAAAQKSGGGVARWRGDEEMGGERAAAAWTSSRVRDEGGTAGEAPRVRRGEATDRDREQRSGEKKSEASGSSQTRESGEVGGPGGEKERGKGVFAKGQGGGGGRNAKRLGFRCGAWIGLRGLGRLTTGWAKRA
jgi:hypothetical protein